MIRRARNSLEPHLRRLHSRASSSVNGARRTIQAHPGAFVSSTLLTAYLFWYTNTHIVHNDAASPVSLSKERQESSTLLPSGDAGNLHAVVWGSNRCGLLPTRLEAIPNSHRSNTLIPDAVETIRTPSVTKWLDGVALRDLAIHRHHAACVDARGDVYQWGDGFPSSDPGKQFKPTLTLRNKVRHLFNTFCFDSFL